MIKRARREQIKTKRKRKGGKLQGDKKAERERGK